MPMRLLLSCPDRPGLVAAVAQFLAARGLNITDVAQHSSESGRFYMRMVFEAPRDDAPGRLTEEFESDVAVPYEMEHRFASTEDRRRVIAMVSRPAHCLRELLWRFDTGDLPGELVGVVSNHPHHRDEVERLGVPYIHVPVSPETRARAERDVLDRVAGQADLVVLARYMQVLSGDFLDQVGCPVINIHHSFLPSFAGAEPYRQAQERGVKLIGATAHYVTEELDAGPIIEQDTARVSHRDELTELVRLGEEIERSVLTRAVRAHLEDRVIVDGNRTVVL